jgi:hypothetical protein
MLPEPLFCNPSRFVTAAFTSLTPFRDNSCDPILCFIDTAFFDLKVVQILLSVW